MGASHEHEFNDQFQVATVGMTSWSVEGTLHGRKSESGTREKRVTPGWLCWWPRRSPFAVGRAQSLWMWGGCRHGEIVISKEDGGRLTMFLSLEKICDDRRDYQKDPSGVHGNTICLRIRKEERMTKFFGTSTSWERGGRDSCTMFIGSDVSAAKHTAVISLDFRAAYCKIERDTSDEELSPQQKNVGYLVGNTQWFEQLDVDYASECMNIFLICSQDWICTRDFMRAFRSIPSVFG